MLCLVNFKALYRHERLVKSHWDVSRQVFHGHIMGIQKKMLSF